MTSRTELDEAWERLTPESHPWDALQLSYLIETLPDPASFISEKLTSASDNDRRWGAWLAQLFPGCEDELFRLIDDDSEIGEMAALALVELCPERCDAVPVLKAVKARMQLMEEEHLKAQWKFRGLQIKADQAFRQKRFADFLTIVGSYSSVLGDVMQKKIAYARNRAEQPTAADSLRGRAES